MRNQDLVNHPLARSSYWLTCGEGSAGNLKNPEPESEKDGVTRRHTHEIDGVFLRELFEGNAAAALL
jgi:hypothetical protein